MPLVQQDAGGQVALEVECLVNARGILAKSAGQAVLGLCFLVLQNAGLNAMQGAPDVFGAHGPLCQLDALLGVAYQAKAKKQMPICALMPLRAQFRVSPYAALFPQSILPLLQGDIAAMKRDIKHLKTELLMTMNLTAFKAWIAARKREVKARPMR